MQVFHPEECPLESVKVIDSSRLNKQRMECAQLLSVILGTDLAKYPNSYRNHIAARIWSRSALYLAWYFSAVCEECDRRGISDNAGWWDLASQAIEEAEKRFPGSDKAPVWLKSEMNRMRSLMYGKDSDAYAEFAPDWKATGGAKRLDYSAALLMATGESYRYTGKIPLTGGSLQ